MAKNGYLEGIDLLSSQARVQVPWVKVEMGGLTFGVYDRKSRKLVSDSEKAIYTKAFDVQYPNYINNLKITKINGQINKYQLGISYPITQFDDPNFFEKVFSKASKDRKIVFSYGDMSNPGFLYKEEEAIITKIGQTFVLEASRIDYTIEATSASALKTPGGMNFIASGKKVKPSDEIKALFKSNKALQNIFTGMRPSDIDTFVAGDDKAVELESKEGINALDYLNYLVGCMQPADAPEGLPTANYIMTIHDNSANNGDSKPGNSANQNNGPFFKVTKIDKKVDKDGAYTLTIGYNTREIVTNFALEQNENYALYYEYQEKLAPSQYVRRLNNDGQWEDVYSPIATTDPVLKKSTTAKENWWKLITSYPINASVTMMGLLRPATLMQYVRLNVVFPGGHKHISSGLYLVTKQEDSIDNSGYRTTLGLTKIAGDEEYEEVSNAYDSMYGTDI
jgi:hypothetical protein